MYSKKDIQRLKEGKELPFSLDSRPFIIIRESVRIRGIDEVIWEWGIATRPETDDYEKLSREEAISIIKHYDMEKSYSAACGQIYELPGRPFYEKFNNAKAA